jgi:hypothetical protein
MKTLKFTYWKDGDYYLGFLNDYPDYQTQGMSKEELVHNLKDLLVDLESGDVPAAQPGKSWARLMDILSMDILSLDNAPPLW